MSSEVKFLHALLLANGGEPQKLFKVLDRYPDAETAWRAQGDKSVNPDDEFEMLARAGIRAIGMRDPEYPQALKEIYQPPQLLYVRGAFPESDLNIAIVGTRKPTEYGKAVARRFGETLAEAGIPIVSGLAYGIDREAHAVVVAKGGKAIAVIGSGLDEASFYPNANWRLAEEIVKKGGAVISEYPPGKAAFQSHFPERNRIIVGTSKGVLLVEARDRSGTQITARLALEENRDVFAVPGSIFSDTSVGPNRLLREGAIPTLSPDDILDHYGRKKIEAPHDDAELSELEQKVLATLREPILFEELRAAVDTEINTLQAALSMLELKGKIHELEPGRYEVLATN